MEIKSCRKCRKLFQYIGGVPMCPSCKEQEEDLFQVVKAYLKENRGATMAQVSKDTGVSINRIESYLKEGRLEISPESPISLRCEQCNTKILSGKLCGICKATLTRALNDAAKDMQGHKSGDKVKEKMRFLNSVNKE